MGLGGDLIWTAILKAVHDHDGEPPVACFMPGISDLLAGRLYEGSVSLRDNAVFRHNPFVALTEARRKSLGSRGLDTAARLILKFPPARRCYEDWIFRRAERVRAEGGPHFVHIDLQRHSYAARQTRRRTYWKQGRAVDAMAGPFGVERVEEPPNLHFTQDERSAVSRLLAEAGLHKAFVAIEPDTNRDWFGELRAWPMDRWQTVVDRVREAHPDLPVAQVGLGRSGILEGVVDLTGRTGFRDAALVIGRATLFIGTEGGLMHAARAVDARALILWGGVTLPEFIGYPDHQTTICKHVFCAPCGNAGWCPNGHRCMLDIEVGEVADTALHLLNGEPG